MQDAQTTRAARGAASITGIGAVSPNGIGIPAFGEALRAGRSGVGLLPFSHPRMKSTVAAACEDFDPASVLEEADLKRLPRAVPMGLAAAQEALAMAGLGPFEGESEKTIEGARRVGLILGTGGGGIDFTLEQAAIAAKGERPSLWTITNATHGNLAGELSIKLGLRGPSLCVSTGCASSTDAIGLAFDQLRLNRPGSPDAWVVVGADSHLRWEPMVSMELLKVISTRDWSGDPGNAHTASRPFCQTRDGFVLGEGAWGVVIERQDFAASREREPVAELLGYGATCDAYHRVRPDPEMTESVRAMRLAIEDAGLAPEDVSVVHYHGTGTQLNDAAETAAVKRAFGGHADRLVGSSVKSMVGHPQGAGGMASVVATLTSLCAARLGLGEAFCPPTINVIERDEACGLEYCADGARELTPDQRVALVNCLAFGAKNNALVVRSGG
ncbi:MAG: beta-ketoacyl-[acyl-carrier-protein] synthase family protein [Planctomycetota bacterium]